MMAELTGQRARGRTSDEQLYPFIVSQARGDGLDECSFHYTKFSFIEAELIDHSSNARKFK